MMSETTLGATFSCYVLHNEPLNYFKLFASKLVKYAISYYFWQDLLFKYQFLTC